MKNIKSQKMGCWLINLKKSLKQKKHSSNKASMRGFKMSQNEN
jgi:hypothetical protein